MAPALLSARPQSLPLLPTIKLGPSGAGSRVGGLVHTLGPCGSLQWPLLWGWEFLLLPPQSPRVFSIKVWGFISPHWSPGLLGLLHSPTFRPGLSVRQCRATGSASVQTACLVRPTLRQSLSCLGNESPLHPGCRSLPLLSVWMNVSFFISLVLDPLAVWFSVSSGCVRRRSASTYASILVLLFLMESLYCFP